MSNKIKTVLDNRHLKILSVKKNDLKNSLVLISLNGDKYGHLDVDQLNKLGEEIHKVEPAGCYFLGLSPFLINIFDINEFKNKDILISIGENNGISSMEMRLELESQIRNLFKNAKSVNFIYKFIDKIV